MNTYTLQLRQLTYLVIAPVLLALSLLAYEASAQGLSPLVKPEPWRQWIAERLELQELSEEEAQRLDALYEQRQVQPWDLNKLHEEELRQLPFLSDYQIYQFLSYRSDQGALRDIAELKLVPGWGVRELALIAPLVYCRTEPSPQPLAELAARGMLELHYGRDYRAAGTKLAQTHREEALVQGYYSLGDRLHCFLGASKPRTAAWQSLHQGLFDRYVGQVELRSTGWLRQLILGDYKLGTGLGLVLGQGNSSLSMQGAQPRFVEGLRGLRYAGGRRYSRGLAVVLGAGAWHLLLAASRQGQHLRLAAEHPWEDLEEPQGRSSMRQAVGERMLAASLGYRAAWGELSLSSSYLDWEGKQREYLPQAQALGAQYRVQTSGLSYRWHSPTGQLQLRGELARASLGGWAVAQLLSLQQTAVGDVTLGAWHLSPRYWSGLGQSLQHRSWVTGEQGLRLYWQLPQLLPELRLTLQGQLYRRLALEASTAVQQHPRLSAVDGASYGSYSTLLSYALDRRRGLELQLYYKRSYSALGGYQRLRLQLEHNGSVSSWRLGLQLVPAQAQHSYCVYAQGRFGWSSGAHLALGFAYFDAPEWRSRLYLSQPRDRHSYVPSLLYGRGYDLRLSYTQPLGHSLRLVGYAVYQRQFVGTRPNQIHCALSCIYRY